MQVGVDKMRASEDVNKSFGFYKGEKGVKNILSLDGTKK